MSKQPESQGVAVLSFYKFVDLDDLLEIRNSLLSFCRENGINGTFILASEGINATVAGPRGGIEGLIACLESNARLSGARYKLSYNEKSPFHRLKVKFKKELIPMGVSGIRPQRLSGQRVPPEQWNELISRPGVLVIDTRNDYENRVGTFRGAVNPETEHFREFPEYVRENLDPAEHREVAMFCTGGIRCEKATSYLLERGFQRVYQLEGGGCFPTSSGFRASRASGKGSVSCSTTAPRSATTFLRESGARAGTAGRPCLQRTGNPRNSAREYRVPAATQSLLPREFHRLRKDRNR